MSAFLALDLPDLPTPPDTPMEGPVAAPVIAYESERVTIYHGRAEHVLPLFPKESFDLVIADPPYGMQWQSRRRKEAFGQLDGDGSTATDRAVIRDILEQCVRVVGQHRHLYVFGPSDVLDGLKVSEVAPLIWDKGAMGSGKVASPWGPLHEPLSFVVSQHRHAGKAGKSTLPTRLRKGSVLSYMRPTGRKVRHPSEKPVALIREMMESSSRQGEHVIDPCAGTGPVGVAAVLSGRRATLIESDRRWVDIAVSRVRHAERIADEMAAV